MKPRFCYIVCKDVGEIRFYLGRIPETTLAPNKCVWTASPSHAVLINSKDFAEKWAAYFNSVSRISADYGRPHYSVEPVLYALAANQDDIFVIPQKEELS